MNENIKKITMYFGAGCVGVVAREQRQEPVEHVALGVQLGPLRVDLRLCLLGRRDAEAREDRRQGRSGRRSLAGLLDNLVEGVGAYGAG